MLIQYIPIIYSYDKIDKEFINSSSLFIEFQPIIRVYKCKHQLQVGGHILLNTQITVTMHKSLESQSNKVQNGNFFTYYVNSAIHNHQAISFKQSAHQTVCGFDSKRNTTARPPPQQTKGIVQRSKL